MLLHGLILSGFRYLWQRACFLIINDVNLGEHVVRSVVVAVVDVVGGVHLAAVAALVTGRLRQKIMAQSYSSQLKLKLQTKVHEDFTITDKAT